jgi:hypothetical protein
MNDRRLYIETQAAKRLKEKLSAAYGDDIDLIRDCIEGETTLHEAIARAALELATVEGEKEGVNIALAKMKERLTRYSNRAAGIREAIFAAMETAELRSIKAPAATLSLKANPSAVEITDPALLPVVYLKQPPPSPDKTAIRDALKAGETVPGAALSNQPDSLSVRFS